ncbi:Alpha-enolase [Tupaia chinensis]|uniref:phosphopyruvate hydratase n=1 Tax=Tupaia chinensis TaxID=246437 RepID=L9L8L6_TUPCH|nr:Alpha-enolase [Tupaia chinensis]
MQGFMILLIGAANFREAIHIGAEVYYNLRNVIKEKYGKDAIGDESGLAPNILKNKEALGLLNNMIGKAGNTDAVVICMNMATSDFSSSGLYDLDFKSPDASSRHITPDQLVVLFKSSIKDFPVVSTEDPFGQDDWTTWQKFIATAGIQVVGDHLTAQRALPRP